MWFISLRDLQFRQRRFLIAIVGTALVFALGLLGSGMSAAFRAEVERTMDAIGADAWVIAAGSSGPFTSFRLLPAGSARDVAGIEGVRRADPLAIVRASLPRASGPLDINVIGYRRIGRPPVADGRLPRRTGEVVADASTGLRTGEVLSFGGVQATIVGTTRGLTFNAGTPNVYARLRDVQVAALRGEAVATAIVTEGIPASAPPGMRVVGDAAAREDMLRPFLRGIGTIDLFRILLWIVAGSIIGAIIYLSSLERLKDFAVLRAVGTSGRALFGGLAIQAVFVSMLSGLVAIGLAHVLVPLFPLEIAIPTSAYALMPVTAILVGLAASTVGLRRATRVDPALAFGGP